MHDVGKKATATVDETGRIRHSGHESVGAEMSDRILTGLRYDNKTIATVHEAVQHHMQFKDVPHMRPSTLKRMMTRSHFPLELELHRIDCSSSHGDLKYYEFLKHQLETMSPDEIDPPHAHQRPRPAGHGHPAGPHTRQKCWRRSASRSSRARSKPTPKRLTSRAGWLPRPPARPRCCPISPISRRRGIRWGDRPNY